MPLTQPRRDNPLMRSYVERIGLSGKALAKICGVSHFQLYMARERHVGPKNAEKIASGIARRLGLSLGDELALRAEIMGHPGDMVRAYLGDAREAARNLGEGEHVVGKVVGGREIPHAPGLRVVCRLEEMGAPDPVIEDVRARVAPRPSFVGRVTNRQTGLEDRNARARGLFNLRNFKPLTHEVLQRAGLPKKEICQRAGVAKETLRKAMYASCGRASATRIAEVLGDELGLTEEERGAIRDELVRAPQKEFGKRAVDEWVEEIRGAGVPCRPVNSLADVFGDKHVLGSGILQGVSILWMPLRTSLGPRRSPPRPSARGGGSGRGGPKTTSHRPWVRSTSVKEKQYGTTIPFERWLLVSRLSRLSR